MKLFAYFILKVCLLIIFQREIICAIFVMYFANGMNGHVWL